MGAMKKNKVSGALMMALALGIFAAGCKPAEEGKEAKQEVKPLAVETREVVSGTFRQTFEFPGVAQPIDERKVSAESSGRILEAPFEEGDRIEKGALMLRVDAKSSAAQINVVRSQVSAAKREYNRIKMLANEGLATPQQLDQATSQLEQANLGLQQARVGQSMSTVRSPFSGTIAKKYLDKGEFAGPGQPLADIIDTSTIKLEVTVPESAVEFVKVGDKVKVTFSATGRAVTGQVIRRGVIVTQPTQTFPIEVHIPNEDGSILPGMRARVIVPKLTLPNAVVISRDALLEGVLQREAMVAVNQSADLATAQLRVVEIGEARGNDVVITSGLEAGDKLIVQGHRNVVDGTAVRIVRERPAMELEEEASDPEPASEPDEPKEGGDEKGGEKK